MNKIAIFLLLTVLVFNGTAPALSSERSLIPTPADPIIDQYKFVVNSTKGIQLIHQQFASHCFNKTWTFIDKKERTAADIEDMILTASASFWHWKQREDCTPTNLSVAYWQMGRVYCLAGETKLAKSFAENCLKVTIEGQLSPFYLGYAYEVLANVELLEKNYKTAAIYLSKADTELAKITDKEELKYLTDDVNKLKELKSGTRFSTRGPDFLLYYGEQKDSARF
jgi:hypothetical protein